MFLIYFIFQVPKIDVIPRVIERGRVYQEVMVEGKFLVINKGDDTLKIKDIKTSCICMAYMLKDYRIAPGDTATLLASINTESLEGEIEEELFIISNDPYEPVLKLKIKTEIIPKPKPQIEAPKVINVGTLFKYEKKEIPLVVKNTGSSDLVILGYVPSASCDIKADFPVIIRSGETEVLTLQINPIKEGVLNEKIRISTNIREYPFHLITVTGVISRFPFVIEQKGDTFYIKNNSKSRLFFRNKLDNVIEPGDVIKIIKD